MENNQQLKHFYKQHVTETLLPFWHKSVDRKHGGLYTCFDNAGECLMSSDKYIWSQGRFVWLWSKMAEMCDKGILSGDSEDYLAQAKKTVSFILDYAMMDNDRCAYLVTENGQKKESSPGSGYDTSIYVDCFVVIGFCRYSIVSQDHHIFEKSLKLFDSIERRLSTGLIRTEPYPIYKGFASHSIPMIMLNVCIEMAEAAKSCGHSRSEGLRERVQVYLDGIMSQFVQKDHMIIEFLHEDKAYRDTLLARHCTPGHTLESMWFCLAAAEMLGRDDLYEKIAQTAYTTFTRGWDQTYGGLYRYIDREGGQPTGRLLEDKYEKLIVDTWDAKIWWPHSEGLYCLFMAEALTGNPKLGKAYWQLHEYTFKVFPNPNRDIGEWIQIRNRQGRPMNKVVALPLKDPFHILRSFLLIIERLEKCSTFTLKDGE